MIANKKEAPTGASFLLKSECSLNLVNIIQFLPGEQFNFDFYFTFLSLVEDLLNLLRLPAHMPVGSGLRIDRGTQVESLFNKIRTHIKIFSTFFAISPSFNFTLAVP